MNESDDLLELLDDLESTLQDEPAETAMVRIERETEHAETPAFFDDAHGAPIDTAEPYPIDAPRRTLGLPRLPPTLTPHRETPPPLQGFAPARGTTAETLASIRWLPESKA